MTKYRSAGLHPWFLTEQTLETSVEWLADLAREPNVVAIGEAGLDKVTGTPWALHSKVAGSFEVMKHQAAADSLSTPLAIVEAHVVMQYNTYILT